MNVMSAQFGTGDNSLDGGVLIQTDELGWVATCTRDAPYSGGAWDALQAWLAADPVNNKIAAYTPPVE